MPAYIYNVLTPAGAALIAQATAANPIVWVGALSKATAAASAEELAVKDAAWYDGKAGEIVAVSATDNVARPVAAWRPSGARQAALSLCVTARLASQTDADAVVMSAMSDPDSTVVLPGADDTGQTVGMPFPIDINAAGTVEVTPGASAALADLDRFVSLYKAGDPTQGEAQTILGEKTFDGDARFDGAVTVRGGILKTDVLQAYSNGPLEIGSSVTPDTDGSLDLGSDEYGFDATYTHKIVGNKTASNLRGTLEIVSYEVDADDDFAGILLCGRGADDFPYVNIHYSSATLGEGASLLFKDGALYCDYSSSGPYLGTSDDPWYEAYLERLDTTAIRRLGNATSITTDSLVPNGNAVYLGLSQLPFADINATSFHGLDFLPADNTADVGKSGNEFRRLYAKELNGVLVHPTASNVDPPVGSIVLVAVMDTSPFSVSVGDSIRSGAGYHQRINCANWDNDAGSWGSGTAVSTACVFRALSEGTTNGTSPFMTYVLAIRVE